MDLWTNFLADKPEDIVPIGSNGDVLLELSNFLNAYFSSETPKLPDTVNELQFPTPSPQPSPPVEQPEPPLQRIPSVPIVTIADEPEQIRLPSSSPDEQRVPCNLFDENHAPLRESNDLIFHPECTNLPLNDYFAAPTPKPPQKPEIPKLRLVRQRFQDDGQPHLYVLRASEKKKEKKKERIQEEGTVEPPQPVELKKKLSMADEPSPAPKKMKLTNSSSVPQVEQEQSMPSDDLESEGPSTSTANRHQNEEKRRKGSRFLVNLTDEAIIASLTNLIPSHDLLEKLRESKERKAEKKLLRREEKRRQEVVQAEKRRLELLKQQQKEKSIKHLPKSNLKQSNKPAASSKPNTFGSPVAFARKSIPSPSSEQKRRNAVNHGARKSIASPSSEQKRRNAIIHGTKIKRKETEKTQKLREIAREMSRRMNQRPTSNGSSSSASENSTETPEQSGERKITSAPMIPPHVALSSQPTFVSQVPEVDHLFAEMFRQNESFYPAILDMDLKFFEVEDPLEAIVTDGDRRKNLFRCLTIKTTKVIRQNGILPRDETLHISPPSEEPRFLTRPRRKQFSFAYNDYSNRHMRATEKRRKMFKADEQALTKFYDNECGAMQCDGDISELYHQNLISVYLFMANSPYGDKSNSTSDMLRGITPSINIRPFGGRGKAFARFLDVAVKNRGANIRLEYKLYRFWNELAHARRQIEEAEEFRRKKDMAMNHPIDFIQLYPNDDLYHFQRLAMGRSSPIGPLTNPFQSGFPTAFGQANGVATSPESNGRPMAQVSPYDHAPSPGSSLPGFPPLNRPPPPFNLNQPPINQPMDQRQPFLNQPTPNQRQPLLNQPIPPMNQPPPPTGQPPPPPPLPSDPLPPIPPPPMPPNISSSPSEESDNSSLPSVNTILYRRPTV